MRFEVEGRFVDFDLNRGIQANFYQELVSLDAHNNELHFLAPVSEKIVATPDLQALFVWIGLSL